MDTFAQLYKAVQLSDEKYYNGLVKLHGDAIAMQIRASPENFISYHTMPLTYLYGQYIALCNQLWDAYGALHPELQRKDWGGS